METEANPTTVIIAGQIGGEQSRLATETASAQATQDSIRDQVPDSTPAEPTATALPEITTQGFRLALDTKGHVIVEIPPGQFIMGSSGDPFADDDELPAHEVAFIESFWIDQFEVTNGQYRRCVEEDTCSLPTLDPSQLFGEAVTRYDNPSFANHPVLFVDWNQAISYCEWRGGRLPTEAEWEYAARGEDQRIYPWGSDNPNSSLVNFGRFAGPLRVGSKRDGGLSFYGLYDMAGNAWEWVADWYDAAYYDQAVPVVNPTGPPAALDTQQLLKVIRGGSWTDTSESIRTASREGFPQDQVDPNFSIGFRCVSLPAESE